MKVKKSTIYLLIPLIQFSLFFYGIIKNAHVGILFFYLIGFFVGAYAVFKQRELEKEKEKRFKEFLEKLLITIDDELERRQLNGN